MRIRRLLVSLAVLAMLPVLWLTGCGSSSTPGTTLTFLSISPTSTTLFPGATQQLTVTAHYSDGSTKASPSGVTYVAWAPSVALVTGSGLMTAVSDGIGMVTARLGDKSADAAVTVVPAFYPVFKDAYTKGVSFVPFGGSTNALVVDAAQYHGGTASLRIDVPASGYTGGALKADLPKDLSLYNAMTFWAKASKAATLNVAGFGNDAAGGPSFSAETQAALTTTWTKFILPIPDPAKLTANPGLFHFAEGSDEGSYSIWLDDVQYERLGTSDLGAPTAATIAWANFDVEIGKTASLTATGTVSYGLPAVTLTSVSLRYFALTPADPTIATVDAAGLVSGLKIGSTTLTAKLGALDVPGSCVATVITPIVPVTAPPRPTVDPSKVISLLSKAYTNVGVDTWGTSWSNDGAGPHLTPLTIEGDDVKKYASLKYVGIEFTGANLIDASQMTYFHLDVWTPDINVFKVKLVDFGANGVWQNGGAPGSDDSECELSFSASSNPALTGKKQWVSLDIPMANFTGMNKAHLAQLILVSGDPYGAGTVYVDNVYFHSSPFVDRVAPTLAITDDVPGASATGDVTFTFKFSEDIGTSFATDDVVVSGGTKGAFAKTDATTYTCVVAPNTNATGTITVSVPAGAFADLASNASTVDYSATQDYDTRAGVKTQMDLPVVTFDSTTVNYGLLGFEGAQDSTIVSDPAGGTNKVAKVVKVATAMLWAGTTLTADGTLGFAHKLPFDGVNSRMTVRVYSPDTGIKVRLKLEDHTNNAVLVEQDALTTVANAWETLTFDFPTADPAKTYDKASIFFNFGAGGGGGTPLTSDKTYYFDDLAFDHFTTLTFDATAVAYTLVGFEGAENSTLVVDPAGGPNKVAKVMKAAGAQAWAGTTITLGSADNAIARLPLTPASSRMLMRVYSPAVGTKVRLKVEKALPYYDANAGCETEVATTASNAWETLVFDFNNQVAGTPALDAAKVYNKLSVFFDYGVADPAKAYYFDDVTLDAFSPVDFDSSLVNHALLAFEGGVAAMASDPSGGSNQVAKFTKPGGAQPWAGFTVATGANASIGRIPFSATGTKITMRVYSPEVGAPILLKVEDAANTGINAEVQVSTTVANAWETLTFDFAGKVDTTKVYNKLSVFGDFMQSASGKVFYFDDIKFLP